MTKKYVRTPEQQEHANAISSEWKRNNPKQHYAHNAKWAAKNHEYMKSAKRLSAAKFRLEHPEESRRKKSAYYQKPQSQAKRRIESQRRRALGRQAQGTFTMEQFYARCGFYGWRCYLCGEHLTLKTVQIEHRIPLSRGGSNWAANLAPSCATCNTKKGSLTEIEYRMRLKQCGSEEAYI